MRFFEELQVAAFAFNLWRKRLQRAVTTGRLDEVEAEIGLGKKDEFGLWIESCKQSDRLKHSTTLLAVEKLHTETQRLAGTILECLKEGRQDEALELLGPKGPFDQFSRRLLGTLSRWQHHAMLVSVRRQMGKFGNQVKKTVTDVLS